MFCYFSQVPKLNLSYDIFHTTSVSYIHVQVSTQSAYVKVGYEQKHVEVCETTAWLERASEHFMKKWNLLRQNRQQLKYLAVL